MGSAGETCRNGNFKDGQIGPKQQPARFFQAQAAIERPGAAVQRGTELPVQLARARASTLAKIGK